MKRTVIILGAIVLVIVALAVIGDPDVTPDERWINYVVNKEKQL